MIKSIYNNHYSILFVIEKIGQNLHYNLIDEISVNISEYISV